ncbi:MAG: hypothetical protein KJ630_18250 [Proteobacteria bacterium]|nr:hypothetical protein [Pseudomonadota bacterium]
MKKIKLLYDVARTMRNMEKIDGLITVGVMKDQEAVFSMRNKFEKDQAGKVKANVSSKMNMNGEDLIRESTTEFTLTGDCHHGPCRMWKSLHDHHCTTGRRRMKGVFHRISLVLGILSSLKVEDQPNGATEISLNLNDVPDEIKTMLLEKMQQMHAGHPDCCCMQGCQNVEMLNGLVVATANEKHAIDKLTVNLNGRAHAAENKVHTLAADVELQFSW